jgi:multidrug efflux pump
MVIAAGASAKSQQALGTVVMGGMIAVVVLALIMVPIFFVVVQRVFERRVPAKAAVHADAGIEPQPGSP